MSRQAESTAGAALDVDALLTIDYGAELRKLARGALEGAWQVPAEMVRLALRQGARHVRLRLDRGRLELRYDGSPPGPDTVRPLQVLLDARASDARRHEALKLLEAGSCPELVALAALRPSALATDRRGDDSILELRGVSFDRKRARSWLQAVCRFADAVVLVDGQELPRGFEDAMLESRLTEGLAGRLALSRTGRSARLWLIQGGVVRTHLTVPKAPPFDAALHADALAPAGASPAALRAAVEGHVSALVEVGVGLWLRLGSAAATLGVVEQQRVRAALLAAAREHLRLEEVLAVRAFPARAPDHTPCWLSLREVAERARSGTIDVLDARADPHEYRLHDTVLILDPDERSRLAELLDVRFVPPRRRRSPRSPARGQALLRALRGLLRGLRRLPLSGRRRLVHAVLTPEERSLREALQRHLPRGIDDSPPRIDFTHGRGPVLSRCRQALDLRLPRDNPVVRAAAAAVSRDPGWAHAAALALLHDAGGPAPPWPAGPAVGRR